MDADQFVQLDMNFACIAVLRTLDQENHQESDDRTHSIDDELPRIGEFKERPGAAPNDHRGKRKEKDPR